MRQKVNGFARFPQVAWHPRKCHMLSRFRLGLCIDIVANDSDHLQKGRAMPLSPEQAAEIEAATQALAKGTEPFAAQRMNRGIQQALAGRKLEEV